MGLKYFILVSLAALVVAKREEKFLSFFNIVKFPNDVCDGNGSFNGTCYTQEECSNKGGSADGSCAEGYGVCCIFQLACGKSSSENCTYLSMGSTTTPAMTNCQYDLCPLNNDICRIRFDFMTFTLAGPGTIPSPAVTTAAGSLGDCKTDTFVVSGSGGGVSTPVICGTNTDQHVYVDVGGGECAKASFTFGEDSSTRQYDIKVLQFACSNEMGGPQGCLQFYTGTSGTIQSFNFQGTSSGSTIHLSNQDQSICMRREADRCGICYFVTPTTGEFAVSASIAAASQSAIDTNCATDYLAIPNAQANPLDPSGTVTVAQGATRLCGRILSSATAATADASVCTMTAPFMVRFVSDDTELNGGTNGILDETLTTPFGVRGFQLNFLQQAC